MQLLLDTHALLWSLAGDPRLPPSARGAIEDQANTAFASAASAWEVATKTRRGMVLVSGDAVLDQFGVARFWT